jgi:hypothetical protein
MSRNWQIVLIAMTLLLASTIAVAGHPQYLIPRSTPTVITLSPVPHTNTVSGQVLNAQPYAYGWFGVQPRRHWSRHFGYYRTYTEWSAK